MSFPAKITVPYSFRWDAMCEVIESNTAYQQVDNLNMIKEHYAWLLQITSFKFGVNWNPMEDYVEVELPLTGYMASLTLEQDYTDLASSVSRDPLSATLLKVVELVPPMRVMSHLRRVPKGRR